MKIIQQAITALLVSSNLLISNHGLVQGVACSPEPLEFSETVGIRVEKVGSIPTTTTGAWSYNMMVADNFDDKVFFLDQLMGKIYSYDPESSEEPALLFDMNTSEIPAGLTLNFNYPGAAQANRVHMMSKGKTANEVYVVFSSSTLPTGYSKADAGLPAEGAYPGYMCDGYETVFVRDLYRVGLLPLCAGSAPGGFASFTIYNVFYKFTISNGVLANPDPFFVLENQLLPGHLGGGMATVHNGKLLWSVGDCLQYGSDGRFAPQVDTESCGKILLIDPDAPGTYDIVAKGVRNSQQMRIVPIGVKGREWLIFMDIGGVTAEEVNIWPLPSILNRKKIDNFGWGRNQMDGKTREGTCYVGPGKIGILGTEPPSEGTALTNENGYIQPWIQFGRTATDVYYGISSFAYLGNGRNTRLRLIWSEFNTGHIMGTMRLSQIRNYNGPTRGYKIKLYDAEGNYLEHSLNDLVKEELGEVGYYRGDPRLFHYPDGTAGVFIERTGVFYRLTDFHLSDLP